MGRIPEETLQAIRDRVDLVELVGRHVALKKAGRSYKGLCPFHHEKTPSFTVNPDRGFYHCFGCGEGGNAFEFLIRLEGLTFPEAARQLAADHNIPIPEFSRGEDLGVGERVLAANAIAQSLYRRALVSDAGRGAREYLAQRGLPHEAIEQFGVGFAPEGWEELARELRRNNVPAAIGEKAGLLRERASGGHYDLLRGRVTFPIQDARGRVIAFGGRALSAEQEPKYLNSPESPVFRKREAFYGFPHALEGIRRSERVVVVEGYFDRIALERAGVPEALATCGTALSEDHARALRRRARNVVLLFDGDGAGRRAALRALEALLPSGLRVRAAALPHGDDPDTLLLREGADALRAIVDGAPAGIELALEDAVARGVVTPEQKADCVAAIVPLLARIPDPTERSAWAQRAAMAAGARVQDVEATLRAAVRGEAEPQADEAPARAPQLVSQDDRQLAQLVQALLDHPHCADLLEGTVGAVADAGWSELLAALVAGAREDAGGSLVARVEGRLGAAALARLHAAGEAPRCDEAQAKKVIGDTARELRRRWLKQQSDRINEQLRKAAAHEIPKLLEEKQRLLIQVR